MEGSIVHDKRSECWVGASYESDTTESRIITKCVSKPLLECGA